MKNLIDTCLPSDHCRQVSARYYMHTLLPRVGSASVLDLGCGAGNSRDHVRDINASIDWKGVDIEFSPEVNARKLKGEEFHTFDGINLPFDADTFDFVMSVQVFEHVRYPRELLGEVFRVLKPGGNFFGSVSYLEPYHSYSYWNYTPYGWKVLLEEAGLTPLEFRPGIDALALITRNYRNNDPDCNKWFVNSPLNEEIESQLSKNRSTVEDINLRKLQYTGHIVFSAIKRLPK